ncbi:hypothetical protein T484DRAFT_1818261 [Baffinella frigidus]|nr:hypothetical protein T484DRAFT_1818261 [Cryptophyta sp. CCMP2293]
MSPDYFGHARAPAVERAWHEIKSQGYALPHNSNVGAVIVGFDRFINYYKIQYAQV